MKKLLIVLSFLMMGCVSAPERTLSNSDNNHLTCSDYLKFNGRVSCEKFSGRERDRCAEYILLDLEESNMFYLNCQSRRN